MFLRADELGELHSADLLPTGREPAAAAPQPVLGPGRFPERGQKKSIRAAATGGH